MLESTGQVPKCESEEQAQESARCSSGPVGWAEGWLSEDCKVGDRASGRGIAAKAAKARWGKKAK